ncbi:hypothetical protein JCM11641_004535 [Rhodosporidiobolus odoratus]
MCETRRRAGADEDRRKGTNVVFDYSTSLLFWLQQREKTAFDRQASLLKYEPINIFATTLANWENNDEKVAVPIKRDGREHIITYICRSPPLQGIYRTMCQHLVLRDPFVTASGLQPHGCFLRILQEIGEAQYLTTHNRISSFNQARFEGNPGLAKVWRYLRVLMDHLYAEVRLETWVHMWDPLLQNGCLQEVHNIFLNALPRLTEAAQNPVLAHVAARVECMWIVAGTMKRDEEVEELLEFMDRWGLHQPDIQEWDELAIKHLPHGKQSALQAANLEANCKALALLKELEHTAWDKSVGALPSDIQNTLRTHRAQHQQQPSTHHQHSLAKPTAISEFCPVARSAYQ